MGSLLNMKGKKLFYIDSGEIVNKKIRLKTVRKKKVLDCD